MRQLALNEVPIEEDKFNERLAKLSGGIAVIHAGGATPSEQKRRVQLIEDALNATKAAAQEGIVPGGGVALFRAAKALDAIEAEGDERTGLNILKRALEEPLRRIADNAGKDGGLIVGKIRAEKKTVGYNAATGEVEDLMSSGIVDAAKVVRTALQNAASIAALMLTTDAVVSDLPEPAPAPGGGEH